MQSLLLLLRSLLSTLLFLHLAQQSTLYKTTISKYSNFQTIMFAIKLYAQINSRVIHIVLLWLLSFRYINSKRKKMSSHDQSVSQSDSMMQQLVNDSKLPNLMSNIQEQIFPVTQDIPEALKYNLNSDNRVVKIIKSNHNITINLIRGFYFQLFKLCFEMYDPKNAKNYLQITKNIIFDRSIIQQSNSENYYKHLAQFFSLMQDEQSYFEQIVSQYHQVDESLISILQQLIQERSSIQENENEIQLILNDLCELFQITLIPNHPFYHFQESNVYLVVENDERCFIVYDENEQDDNQQDEEDEEQQEEQVSSEAKSSNVRSQISVSSQSKNPSQLTQNNLKNDGNFSKQYTFQPQFKGQHEIFQNSNKVSEISNSINSKQCSSRPVSNISYKSHLSSQSEYKRQQIGNRYDIKIESKVVQNNAIAHSQRLDVPQNQPPYTHDPFKKGTFKISNPYQISSPSNFNIKVEDYPISQKFGSHYFSPSPTNDVVKQKQVALGDSHYVNNSISNYYEGYYGDLPHNNSTQSVNSKNDTIINIFGDMLKSGKYDGSYSANSEENIGNRPTKKQIEHTEKILQAQQQFQKQDSSDIYPNFMKKINKLDTVDMMGRAKSVNSINEQHSDFNTNSISGSKTLEFSIAEKPQIKENYYIHQHQNKIYSTIAEEKSQNFVEGPSSNIENKSYMKSTPMTNFDSDDSIFYKPKKSQLKVISQVTASKESISIPRNNDNHFDDSKGSIYRQFSDTRILKLLKQPHKTKVQIMRNRFKGQHFNI